MWIADVSAARELTVCQVKNIFLTSSRSTLFSLIPRVLPSFVTHWQEPGEQFISVRSFAVGSVRTLSAFSVPPSKATGATRVGGMPACAPVVVMVVLLFRRKLKRAWTFVASTLTTDSGWLSMLTGGERWLGKWSRSKYYGVEETCTPVPVYVCP